MTEEYIDVKDGKRLFYRQSGSGPALLLLHGFPCDGSLWNEIHPALSASYNVIIPDLPGVGQSDLLSPDQSIEDMAEAIARLLARTAEDEGAVVIGHSMGGYVALALAEHHSTQITGLSLVHSTASPDSEEKKLQRNKAIALIEKGGREEFVRSLVPALFSPQTKDQKPALLQQTLDKALQLPAASAKSFYNAMMQRPDRTGVIKALKIPVQWVLGRDDSVIPLMQTLEQTTLSDVNFVSILDDCGHMSMLEHPTSLFKALQHFVEACTAFPNSFNQPA